MSLFVMDRTTKINKLTGLNVLFALTGLELVLLNQSPEIVGV